MDLQRKLQLLRDADARREAMSISSNLFETLVTKAETESASYEDFTGFKTRVFTSEDIKPLPAHVSRYFASKGTELLRKSKPPFVLIPLVQKTKYTSAVHTN